MPDKVKWAVLGNATIARKCVIPAIQKSRNGQVRLLATRSPAAAGQVVADNRIPQVIDAYEKALDDPQIDAVYIPLPNHLHLPWTLKALAAGKHVLCEKPLACNAAEAGRMTAAARESGLTLMEAFMYRFHPRSRRIKGIVDDGGIGKPCLVHSAFCYHMAEDVLKTGENFRLGAETGGGAILDVGSYGVSVARWMMAIEPVQVLAQAVYHPRGPDIHMAGILRFPEGQLATVEASFVSALQQTFTVVGSKGAVELPHDAFIPWEKDAVFIVREKDQETGTRQVVPGADEYQLMVEHFGDIVLGKVKPDYGPEDSVANMRVLDALAKAARSGKTIDL